MRKFTLLRNSILGGLTLMLMLALPQIGFSQTNQSHTVIVSAPANAAGEYQALIGNFGPVFCEVDDISGELILVTSGDGSAQACDTVTNDLSGKIALIDRGSCDFSTKVYNAQQKGAIAVIVCDATASQDYVFMGPGTNADLVTIPSFFMLKSDCDIIKAGLPEGVTLTIDRNDIVDDFDGEIVFEETFDGSLNGWTAVVSDCNGASVEGKTLWRHSSDGTIEDPCSPSTILSPTRCNGAAVFESSQQDSGGAGCGGEAIGSGPCPSPHIGVLTSPAIDLTQSSAAGYSVRFRQLTRVFRSQYFVGWSYDGGVTWDSIAVNADLGTNEFNDEENDVIKVPLPGSIDASSVTLRFRLEADYYFWAIDDVQIIAQEANNLQVNGNFFAIPPNLLSPVSQQEPINFLADIENVGSATQTNVTLNITVVDTNFTIVYSDDLAYNDVPANTLVENIPFDNGFTPTQEGEFLGLYSISADSADADDSNDAQVFQFAVTEDQFAKEVGGTRTILPAQAEWSDNEGHSWAYGNYYYVPNGDGFFMKDVSFALGNPTEVVGSPLIITLYEWTEDTNNDGNMDPTERVPVAFTFYVVAGTEGVGETITVPFPGEGEDPVALKDDTEYVLMLEYFANSPADPDFVLVAADDRDYNAQVFLSQILGTPRYASMLGIAGDLTQEPYSSLGFGREFIPVARMSITSSPTSTKELEDIAQEFTVYPNPTEDILNLTIALQEQEDQATVRIMDVSGKTILQRNYENIQREFFNYDVSRLPGGTYFLQLTTNTGTGTKRFVVKK